MRDEVTDTETDKIRTVNLDNLVASKAEEGEIERDDFGLPIKKLPVPVDEQTPKIDEGDSNLTTMSQRGGFDEQKAAEDLINSRETPNLPKNSSTAQEEDSEGDEDFKDAPSTPISDAQTPHTPSERAFEDGKSINQKSSNQDVENIQAPETTGVELKDSEDTLEAQNSGKSKEPPLLAESSGEDPITASAAESIQVTEKVEPKLNDIIQAQSGEKPIDAEFVKDHSKASIPEGSTSHQRAPSHTNGISEWSHQHMAPRSAAEKEDDDEGWQEMPAFAPYDIYDDDNRLVAREAQESDDEAADTQALEEQAKGTLESNWMTMHNLPLVWTRILSICSRRLMVRVLQILMMIREMHCLRCKQLRTCLLKVRGLRTLE